MKNRVWFSGPLLVLALLPCAAFSADTPYSNIVLEDDPYLYWNFDETAGNALQKAVVEVPEESPNDLVPFGAERVSHASITSGLNLGNAAQFNGATYFMAEDLAAHTNSIEGAYLIEFWMQVQGTTDAQRNDYLLNFGAGGGNAPAVLYDYVGGVQERGGIELYSGGRSGFGPVIMDDEWHHLVLAFYGNETIGVANRVDMYLDGVSAGEFIRETFSSALNIASRLVVGTSVPQFAAGDGFEGRIDELAVYDLTSLQTEAEVASKALEIATDHFAQAKSAQSYADAVLADSPALYWNFDEASGNARQLAPITPVGTETDNDLVQVGDVIRYSHEEVASGLNLGRLVDFDGSSGVMRADDLNVGVESLAAPWGVEFWMQSLGPDDGRRSDYLISFGQSGGNEPAIIFDYLGADEDNAVELFQLGGRSGSSPMVADQEWKHIFIVSYGTDVAGLADRLEIFVDGVSHGTIRNTFTAPLNLASQFLVGSSPVPADGFEGRMDEVAVYSFADVTTETALETKVTEMITRRLQVAQATTGSYTDTILADNPLLYYNFEETEGDAIQRAPAIPTTEPPPENSLVATGAERVSHSTIGSNLALGNAAEFDGTSYFMAETLNTPKASLAGPWILEFWFQVQGANDALRSDYVMNFGAGGGNQPAVLFDYIGAAQADNGLELFAGGNRTGAGPVINDQDWHHAVFAYYGSDSSGVADKLDIYLDGELAAGDVRNTFASPIVVDARLVLGTSAPAFAAADGFEGRLDELALYDLSDLTTEAAITERANQIASTHFAAAQSGDEGIELSVNRTGTDIVISWPNSTEAYVLETTSILPADTWAAVTTAPVENDGRMEVTIPTEDEARFFRLSREQ